MGAVLSWIGWVLLILLALLVLALVIPAGVSLRYQGGELAVKVSVLGLPFKVLPTKPLTPEQEQKKEQKAQKKQRRKAEKAERKKAKPQKSKKEKPPKRELTPAEKLHRLLHRVGCFLKRGGWLVKKVFACLRIRHVEVYLPIAQDTAAGTALGFGSAAAALGSALGVLQNFLDIRIDRWEIDPDFAGLAQGREVFACKIHAQLIIMIGAGLYTLYQLMQDRAL